MIFVIGVDRPFFRWASTFVSYPLKLFTESLAMNINSPVEPIFIQFSRPDARAHHGRGEPGTLFVGPIDDNNRSLGLNAIVVDGPQYLQGAHDPQDPVEAATFRLGIHMRADHYRWKFGAFAGSFAKDVPHLVNHHLKIYLMKPLYEQISGLLVFIRQRQALNASSGSSPYFGHFFQGSPEALTIYSEVFSMHAIPPNYGNRIPGKWCKPMNGVQQRPL